MFLFIFLLVIDKACVQYVVLCVQCLSSGVCLAWVISKIIRNQDELGDGLDKSPTVMFGEAEKQNKKNRRMRWGYHHKRLHDERRTATLPIIKPT